MKTIHIPDKQIFQSRLLSLVDTTITFNDLNKSRKPTGCDYFGELNTQGFKVYSIKKGFITWHTILKFNGQFTSENTLTIKTSLTGLWVLIFNYSILLIFGIAMLFNLDYYYGLILLAVTFIQLIWQVYLVELHRKKFFWALKDIVK